MYVCTKECTDMSETNICPLKKCSYEFKSSHYTDKIPHLETHSVKELSNMVSSLLFSRNWSAKMAEEIISSCETIVNETKRLA